MNQQHDQPQSNSADISGISALTPDDGLSETALQTYRKISNEETGAFIISLGTILAAFASPVTLPLGVAAIIFGTLMPVYWPTNNPNVLWQAIAEKIRIIIDVALQQYAINQAIAQAKTMADMCAELKTSLNDWLNSGKTVGAGHIRNQYSALLLYYMPHMHLLAPGMYRGALLPQYVNAGMNYLSILNAIYPYADELGLATRDTNFSGKPHVLSRIIDDTARLIDQAIESYQFGQQEITRKTSNEWEEYNTYRTVMTYSALDFLSLFPYFNPESYPASISLRCLNRKILMFFDTSLGRDQNDAINDIVAFERKINPRRAVLKLRQLKFTYGKRTEQKILPGLPPLQLVFDGLARIECQTETTDGRSQNITLTDAPIESDFSQRTVVALNNIFSIPFFQGTYWSDSLPGKIPKKTFNRLLFYAFWGSSGQNHGQRDFPFNPTAGFPTSNVYASLPDLQQPIQSFPDKSFYSETLEELRILRSHRTGELDAALLSVWHHKSIEDNMLPRSDHSATPVASTPIEQFHAIRAAASIQQQNLSVIPGPGFTGGDLVAIAAGHEIEFLLTNNRSNWFAGFYRVRLWYLRSASPLDIAITASSSGDFPLTMVSEIIPAQGAANIPNPSYADLKSFTYRSTLLITQAMPDLRIRLFNAAWGSGDLILDRIEFIKDQQATN